MDACLVCKFSEAYLPTGSHDLPCVHAHSVQMYTGSGVSGVLNCTSTHTHCRCCRVVSVCGLCGVVIPRKLELVTSSSLHFGNHTSGMVRRESVTWPCREAL